MKSKDHQNQQKDPRNPGDRWSGGKVRRVKIEVPWSAFWKWLNNEQNVIETAYIIFLIVADVFLIYDRRGVRIWKNK
jgi:hypothetical protein